MVILKLINRFTISHVKRIFIKYLIRSRKFTKETITKITKSAINRVLCDDTKNKISIYHKGKKLSSDTIYKLSTIAIVRVGIPVEVTQISIAITKHYSSLTEVGKALGVRRAAISKGIKLYKVIKKYYIVKYINKK